MMVNLKTTIEIYSNDGELKILSSISKKIPDFKDFEAQGFATAFNSLEMAGMSPAKEGLGKIRCPNTSRKGQKKYAQDGEALGLQNLRRIKDKYVIESVVWTTSLRLVDGDTTVSNTASTFFAPKQPYERWYSNHCGELAYDAVRNMSDRAAADFLNKIRCQETGVIPTTLRNHGERGSRKNQTKGSSQKLD